MNINCMNIGRRSLNLTNMNLLLFNNIEEMIPSDAQVLSILLPTLAISANVERVHFKGLVA